MNTSRRSVINCLLVFLCLCAALSGQTGIVKSGDTPVPGATVTATQGDRRLVTATDENGRYTFDGMGPGKWTIQVEQFGFVTVTKEIEIAGAPVNLEWNLTLKPPPSIPREPLPQQASARASGNAGPMWRNGGAPRGSQTPARGNAAYQRAGAPPQRGAAPPGQQQQNNGFQTAQNVIEGQNIDGLQSPQPAEIPENAGSTESFLINGSVSRGLQLGDTTSVDEMAMQRGMGAAGLRGENPFGPQGGPGGPGAGSNAGPGIGPGGGPGGFGGRFGGGFGGGFGGLGGFGPGGRGRPGARARAAQSGAFFGNRANRGNQQIRGSLFFSLRNSALDASPYALNGQDSLKPSYAQSRFGFNIGGPLVIPKLVNSPNTFFFLNYTGTRARNPYRSVGAAPTLAERNGDFSALSSITLYDPTTHAPLPGNVIPASRLDPVALGLLHYIPLPNQPGIQNYAFVGSTAQNSDNLNTRVIQNNITRRDRLALGFNLQRRSGNMLQPFTFRDETSGSGWNSNVSWTHTFSARALNTATVSFNRNTSDTLPFFAFGENVAAALGIAGASQDPINFGPPNISFTNFLGLTDASAISTRAQSAGVTEGFILNRGSHNLSFGLSYQRTELNTRTDQNGRGTFSFSGLATSGFDAAGLPLANTGYDFADFLLGLPQSASVRFGDTSTYFRGQNYAAYAQDDWRIKTNLTLNFGLRYEYFTPLAEKYGHIANLDIAPGFTGVAVVTPGKPGPYTGAFPAALINSDKNNFAPRLGLAWRPRAEGNTQLRASYGIYYNSSIYNQLASRMAAQPPWANTSSVTTSLQTPLTIETGLIAIPAGKTILNTYAVARDYAVPYAQTWTASIQQQITRGFVVEIGYLGTKGTRLDIQRLPNRAAPGSPLTAEERRLIGNATGFTFESSDGNSIYHALQVRITRRFRRGVSFNALYTFGKSIDNSSTFGGAGNTVAQDDRNLHAERGLSSFDRRHTLTGNFILTSPVANNNGFLAAHDALSRLLKDWTLSGGLTLMSGTPLTARVLGNQADTAGTGAIGAGRADATGLPLEDGAGEFFNLLAFTIPPPGRFGNAGRNTIPGPGMFALNASFGRSFSLSERKRLEFRLEAQNVTNCVNITNVGTVVNALTYGLPLSAGGMRTMNALVRFRF